MIRITVLLNEIYNLNGVKEGRGLGFKAQAASICELAGADGLAYRISSDSFNQADERTVRLLKEISHIPIALVIPGSDREVEKTIDLKPDMAVILSSGASTQDYITRLQVSDIIAAVMMGPELDLIKDAAKMKADYVVIDVTSYCTEQSYSNKIVIFDKVAKAAALAKRLSMGAIIYGPLTPGEMTKFAELEGVEEFFVGQEMAAKAILNGLEKTLNTFKKAAEV
jgi:pyridoxine 5'-phosphate synthase PdxJ